MVLASRRCLALLTLATLPFVAALVSPPLIWLGLAADSCLLAMLLIDWLSIPRRSQWSVRRRVDRRFFFGEPGRVGIAVENRARRTLRLHLVDRVPRSLGGGEPGFRARVPGGMRLVMDYPVDCLEQGHAAVGPMSLIARGPFGIGLRHWRLVPPETVEVLVRPAVALPAGRRAGDGEGSPPEEIVAVLDTSCPSAESFDRAGRRFSVRARAVASLAAAAVPRGARLSWIVLAPHATPRGGSIERPAELRHLLRSLAAHAAEPGRAPLTPALTDLARRAMRRAFVVVLLDGPDPRTLAELEQVAPALAGCRLVCVLTDEPSEAPPPPRDVESAYRSAARLELDAIDGEVLRAVTSRGITLLRGEQNVDARLIELWQQARRACTSPT